MKTKDELREEYAGILLGAVASTIPTDGIDLTDHAVRKRLADATVMVVFEFAEPMDAEAIRRRYGDK